MKSYDLDLINKYGRYITRYLYIKNKSVSNRHLNMILYYLNLESLLEKGKPLFANICFAYKYGPVFESIYFDYGYFGSNPITNAIESDIKILDEFLNPEELLELNNKLVALASLNQWDMNETISKNSISFNASLKKYKKYGCQMDINDIKKDTEVYNLFKSYIVQYVKNKI